MREVWGEEGRRADRGRLLITCPDRRGIVAAISQFLFERGANIIHSDQHATAYEGGVFFMRVDFTLPELLARGEALKAEFSPVAASFDMEWRLSYASFPQRLAIFVSREEHCLLELLWQCRAGDIRADIALVVSNHPTLQETVSAWNIPFHYTPIQPGEKREAERAQLALVNGQADVIVLARYMQILTADFLSEWQGKVINIHHGFLPAFVGARAYDQAYERGVKLIGATAHYVTEDLDAGPIIEQDVQRVDHGDTPDDLRRIGRSIERHVLARAVAWHVEDRILIHQNKTVVFA